MDIKQAYFAMKSSSVNLKKVTGIIIAVLIIIGTISYNLITGINDLCITTLLYMVAFLVLLITEAMEMALLCLVFIVLMPVMGITESFPAALSGFSNQIIFFLIASFGIEKAFVSVPLTKRILKTLLKVSGKNINGILFSLFACTALVSSVISNIPTCAISMALGTELINIYKDGPEKKNIGRAAMIGVTVSSMIGGIMTPAGSSVNIIAISMLEKYSNVSISFLQWMCFGIPMAILIFPMCWFIVIKKWKPRNITEEEYKQFTASIDIPDQITANEKKLILVFVIMITLWVTSSITNINVAMVAVIGCCLLIMPKFGIITVKEFLGNINLSTLSLVAITMSMSDALVNNGISGFFSSHVNLDFLTPAITIPILAASVFLLLIIIPCAPSLLGIMLPTLLPLAGTIGVNPALIAVTCGICACNCYLFPLDTACLITYSRGYYSMSDMPKTTVFLQLWTILMSFAVIYPIAAIFGWI